MDKNGLEIQNLTKHCNEDLILAVLRQGKMHGYQIALEIEEKSSHYFRFNHGTLYPILHKLEKEGKIRGEWLKEESRRKRKQYSLTARGKKYADSQALAWKEFFDQFLNITGGAGK
ncbi:MAG: helix-turn-helix transcriptional regulator [Candidatus Krumholzibacteriota bacterium]|nr:helix-turn-helix transcriptional regulator [Candidatus Krumholzibacteriota bacterium]